MTEKKFDQMLQIRTDGIREWTDRNVPYNRYEPTPYKALEHLFKMYKLQKTDRVVDFGCGRGRVSFYIHHRFRIPVTGIEVNDKTFEEAIDNKAGYRLKMHHIHAPLRFKFGLAEQYRIRVTDNRFYFFNPFSTPIFKQVVHNILESVQEERRTVDLILYYPIPEYKLFLKKSTPFKLHNKVPVPGSSDHHEKFLIYRMKA